MSNDYLSIDDTTLSINLQEGRNFLQKITPETIVAILLTTKAPHLTTLNITLPRVSAGLEHQGLVTQIVNNLTNEGSHIRALSIRVLSDFEPSYTSHYSVDAATALKQHGRYLSKIDVSVNDKGALAFAETCLELHALGTLTQATIKPIKSWKPATSETVHTAMQRLARANESEENRIESSHSNYQFY